MFAASILSGLMATAPIQTDCLFILSHAGETNELLPIMEEMQHQRRNFRVLPLGVAQDLIKNRIDIENSLKAEDFGLTIDKQWPLDRELSDENVQKLVKAVQTKFVVTGVHMLPHKQFLEAYRGHAKTAAFWDNPEPRGAVPYFSIALRVQASAEKVLFPSGFVASAAEFQRRRPEEKIVVGKPTLLLSLQDLHKIDKKAVLKKLQFSQDLPVIAFIGTYGEAYQQAFKLFVESLKSEENQQLQVIFQMHPMSSGDFEVQCCQRILGEGFTYVISPKDPNRGVSMIEAMAASNVIATYNSSAGFQALLGDKKVLYIVPDQDAYSNSLIERGLAAKTGTIEQVRNAMGSALDSMPASKEASRQTTMKESLETVSQGLIKSMEIPLNPIERFLSFLDHELG